MCDHETDLLKQEFDLHIDFLKENNKAIVDRTSKLAGFLLLGLGWLVTSDDARDYLHAKPELIWFVVFAAAFGFLLSVVAAWLVYRASKESYYRLVELSYISELAFKNLRLSLATFLVCVIGIGILFCLVVLFLLGLLPNFCITG